MNTRQKLTLGIAAIFMVTLTVIGVTYAYFVTRVNYNDGTATAVINTAKIGSNYEDDNNVVTLTDALPGDVVYKTFSVNNDSDVAVPFSITLGTKLNTHATKGTCTKDGETVTATDSTDCTTNKGGTWTATTLPMFVHSNYASGTCSNTEYTNQLDCERYEETWTINTDLTNKCYVSAAYGDDDDTLPAECYNGTSYDNILVELWRVENYTAGKDTFITTSVTDTIFNGWETCSYNAEGKVDYSTCNNEQVARKIPVTTNASNLVEAVEAPYHSSTATTGSIINLNQKNGTVQELVEAKDGDNTTSNLYVLKVTYVNVNKNQNIENDASVSLKVDISATGAITQGQ